MDGTTDMKPGEMPTQDQMKEAFEKFLSEATTHAFGEMWESRKKQMRELSKQDLAELSFFEGARFMFFFMQRVSEEGEKAANTSQ